MLLHTQSAVGSVTLIALFCLQGATRFSSSLTEAANSLHGGIELQKPEQQYVDSIELKAAAFSRAANDDTVLQHFNEVRCKSTWYHIIVLFVTQFVSSPNAPCCHVTA